VPLTSGKYLRGGGLRRTGLSLDYSELLSRGGGSQPPVNTLEQVWWVAYP
jgi:hypothetical protein